MFSAHTAIAERTAALPTVVAGIGVWKIVRSWGHRGRWGCGGCASRRGRGRRCWCRAYRLARATTRSTLTVSGLREVAHGAGVAHVAAAAGLAGAPAGDAGDAGSAQEPSVVAHVAAAAGLIGVAARSTLTVRGLREVAHGAGVARVAAAARLAGAAALCTCEAGHCEEEHNRQNQPSRHPLEHLGAAYHGQFKRSRPDPDQSECAVTTVKCSFRRGLMSSKCRFALTGVLSRAAPTRRRRGTGRRR